MKDSLAAGLGHTTRITVDKGRTISFMGDDLRVYATPSVVLDVESTCRDLLLQHVEHREDSVGTRMVINHMAPTMLDMWVEILIEIAKVDGRLVTFEFTVRDAVEDVAKGTHMRFVVDKEKTAQRLAAKAAKAADGS
jgi:fluoroacetyl-CoA thioesterase